MNSLVVLLGLFIVLLGIGWYFRTRLIPDEPAWPFYAKKPMSQVEQVLYHRLVKALPECIVLAQVQASRILGVKKGNNFGTWNNRINRLSLDYVVCLGNLPDEAAIQALCRDAPIRRLGPEA